MNTRAVKERLQAWQDRAGEGARRVGTTTDHYVRENTWTTIALAAVAGCILGYLLVGSGAEEQEED